MSASDKTDSRRSVASWFVLLFSGMPEAAWAAALGASRGFRLSRPTVVFFVSLTLTMAGLAWVMAELPTGTAYAVWVGIGATLTVAWGFATGQERPTVARGLLVLLVGSVIRLKAVS